MRVGFVAGVLVLSLMGTEVAAQALRSDVLVRKRALPRMEMAFGIDQWQYAPDSAETADGWTRWGVVLTSRGSLLGQWNLGSEEDALLIGDFVDVSLGFFGATGQGTVRESPLARMPLQLGAQLGKLTAGGTQLVGRAGLAIGIGSEAYRGPFIGGRVKGRAFGLESTYTMADNADIGAVMVRWYPRTRLQGFNMALRYELQRYEPSFFGSDKGAVDRSLMLVFSAER